MAADQSITFTPEELERFAFGHWLSGITDGDGHFELRITYNKKSMIHVPKASFVIGLRADDQDVLTRIRYFFGVGSISTRLTRPKGQHPFCVYKVSKSGDLKNVICPHFDNHPLIAKKRHDFIIWKRGVDLLYRVRCRKVRNHGVGKGTIPKWSHAERSEFCDLVAVIRAQRQFRQSTDAVPLPIRCDNQCQLHLFN